MTSRRDTLSLHDIVDAVRFSHDVAEGQLRAWGAYLPPADREDLIASLLETLWRLNQRYDPAYLICAAAEQLFRLPA